MRYTKPERHRIYKDILQRFLSAQASKGPSQWEVEVKGYSYGNSHGHSHYLCDHLSCYLPDELGRDENGFPISQTSFISKEFKEFLFFRPRNARMSWFNSIEERIQVLQFLFEMTK